MGKKEEKKVEAVKQKQEEKQVQSSMPEKNKYKKRMIVVISVLTIFFIISYIALRGTYLEIKEIGQNYLSIYWKNVSYLLLTLLINFGIIYIMVYITNRKIKTGLKEFFDQEKKTMPKFLNKSIAFISAIFISTFTSNIILEKAMLCFNSTEFGITDPNFGIDIGYFIFKQPFLELILWYFTIAVIVLLIYKVIYYITTFNIFFEGVDKKAVKNSKLIKQITTSIMILVILIAGLTLLEAQDIGNGKFLTLNNDATTYSLYGAGFVDSTIKVWGYRLLAFVMVVSVFKAINEFIKDRNKRMIGWLAIVPAYLVMLFIAMAGTQGIYVDANEYDKEKNYISSNIRATKQAYGVDVDEISLEEAQIVNAKDVIENNNIYDNIAIVDSNIVLKDLNSGQTAKGYYSYRTSQIGKYNINGKEELVYISPREIITTGRNL